MFFHKFWVTLFCSHTMSSPILGGEILALRFAVVFLTCCVLPCRVPFWHHAPMTHCGFHKVRQDPIETDKSWIHFQGQRITWLYPTELLRPLPAWVSAEEALWAQDNLLLQFDGPDSTECAPPRCAAALRENRMGSKTRHFQE